METKDIFLTKSKGYQGYALQCISESLFTLDDLKIFRQLQLVPAKVSRFLDRSKIKSVFKSDHHRDPLENYYLVVATDNTIFHLEY